MYSTVECIKVWFSTVENSSIRFSSEKRYTMPCRLQYTCDLFTNIAEVIAVTVSLQDDDIRVNFFCVIGDNLFL